MRAEIRQCRFYCFLEILKNIKHFLIVTFETVQDGVLETF